jgi:hypothetical protein
VTTQLDPALILFLERLVALHEGARDDDEGCSCCSGVILDEYEFQRLADMARHALATGEAPPLPTPNGLRPGSVPPLPKVLRKYRSTEQGRAVLRQTIRMYREDMASAQDETRPEWARRARASSNRGRLESIRYLLKQERWDEPRTPQF